MNKPLLLDLFCGAGGAGEGYARAGFRVVGCDIDPKPLRHNPHECYVGDALQTLDTLLSGQRWQGYRLNDFAVIHASPVCKAYTVARHKVSKSARIYPRQIEIVREMLQASALTYVIENVPGASLKNAVMLCGTMFGLGVRRHRLFESPLLAAQCLLVPASCQHKNTISVFGHDAFRVVAGQRITASADQARAAMGIDWMTRDELSQAIPPAYTEWLGRQIICAISAEQEASA